MVTINNSEILQIENKEMIFIEYENFQHNNVAEIANNTEQTWQPTRGEQETLNNTLQGKLAEDIFEAYVRGTYPDINLLSYDEIRNDNFCKHAPFDFLVWKGECNNIDSIITSIQADISRSDRFVNLSLNTRSLCENNNVKIVEVKSTKVAQRHKRNFINYNDDDSVLNIAKVIHGDDFLTYPKYCRKTSNPQYSENDYIQYLSNLGNDISNLTELREFEKNNQTSDVFFRVYVDENFNKAYLVGWISKDSFYSHARLKRMPQFGKSELALYFAVPLADRKNPDSFNAFLDE